MLNKLCFNFFFFFLKHFICVYPSLIIHTWAITTDMKAGQSLRSAASRVWRGHVGFTLIFKALVMWFLYWDVGSWTQPCPAPPRLCLSTIKTVTGWCIKTAAASSIRTRGYCVTVSLCQSSCICMYVSMYVCVLYRVTPSYHSHDLMCEMELLTHKRILFFFCLNFWTWMDCSVQYRHKRLQTEESQFYV